MKIEIEELERQVIERMRMDNPWWTSGKIPDDIHQMKSRLYLDSFYKVVKDVDVRRGIVLMGPRRVGKTIMIYHTVERLINDGVNPQSIIYLSIDTPIYNGMSLEMLLNIAKKSLAKQPTDQGLYVFYDEVQYLKDWELHLKSLVDTYRSTRFIVSGSAAAALKMKSTESGAGRFHDFALPPLTFNEYIHLQELDRLIVPKKIEWNQQVFNAFDTIDIAQLNEHFIRYINYGGYPEVVFSKEIQQDPGRYMRRDIVDKVMLKDLPSLYGINDTQELYRLFIHIAYRSGCEFSYEEMSQESGIRKDIIRKYISYLESAFLIKVIHRVDANAKRMQRITQFKTETDKTLGSMVETALFAQRIQRDDEEVFYANWKMGRENGEVDMVGLDRLRQKPIWAVEMKWSDRYFDVPSELKSLLSFMDKNHLVSAIVSSRTKYGIKNMENCNLTFMPSALYAYLLGYNTIEQKKY